MSQRPSRIELLELDIDLRLADLWREADDITEWNLEIVAGQGTATFKPSQLSSRVGHVQIVGTVIGPIAGDSYGPAGQRFLMRDIRGTTTQEVPVVYRGEEGTLFGTWKHILVTGELRNGVFVADRTSMLTQCPSTYLPKKDCGRMPAVVQQPLRLFVVPVYAGAAVAFNRVAAREVFAWVLPTLGVVASFFSLLLVAVASPSQTPAAPADGLGLNPTLQNPYMVIHPPML